MFAGAEVWLDWDWVADHTGDIVAAVQEHVYLTVVTVGVGLVISFPLALAVRRWRRLEAPVLAVTGLMYTIPSLALFAFLVPITGLLSRTTALIGLVSYTLLILLRNILAGLEGVPTDVKDTARGMGYTPLQQLFRVELPLATPVILAGARIATVTTIGLVTVTAVLGQGGLGQFIRQGFARDFRTMVVIGSVLSVVLAVVADLALVGLQRALTPWSRAGIGK